MSTPENPGPYGDPFSAGQPHSATDGQQAQPYPASGGYPAAPGYQPSAYPQPGYAQPGYAQPGYAQPGYAQPGAYAMPAYPGGPMGAHQVVPGPPPLRPGPVTVAFWLWIVAAVVSIVSAVLVFTSDVWSQALAAAGVDSTVSGLAVTSLINTAKTIAVVVGVIFLALYVFFAVKMYLGRNWARVVLTVLAGLTIISAFSSGATATVRLPGNDTVYEAGTSSALTWVQAGLTLLALILMYLGPSNAYFTAVKNRRRYVR